MQNFKAVEQGKWINANGKLFIDDHSNKILMIIIMMMLMRSKIIIVICQL